jgi:hypothetical protein
MIEDNKRGELTSAQIVTITVIIIGFLVVAFFLTGLFTQGNLTDKELCKLSVVERATLPRALQNQGIISLQCTAEKICISESGKKDACKEFSGEKNIRGVKLTGNTENKAKIIERESANAMFDCWSMMGGGKLDIFGGDITYVEAESACVVCSRVALAEDVKEEVKREIKLNEYLANNQVPGSSLTYLQTFTDKSVSSYAGVDSSVEQEGLSSNHFAFVFMQIRTDKSPGDAFIDVVTGGFVFGASSLLTSTGRAIALKNPIILALAGGAATTAGGVAAFQANDNQALSAGLCGEFETRSEKAKRGCSVVRPINWDASAINSFCGRIEGNL